MPRLPAPQQFHTSEWWCQKVGAARPGLSPSPRRCLDLSVGGCCDQQAASSLHFTLCM
ncbi:hypothetical protein I79_025604 [Cricetulus griseus]|uniref:Uncharacterized protein n=1 Tax=Cricetulus griseus TaxID=10029 RepID=G3INS0_CRIGR|nr:hypothetical protein I79_025604 [Cricetulus griseus]